MAYPSYGAPLSLVSPLRRPSAFCDFGSIWTTTSLIVEFAGFIIAIMGIGGAIHAGSLTGTSIAFLAAGGTSYIGGLACMACCGIIRVRKRDFEERQILTSYAPLTFSDPFPAIPTPLTPIVVASVEDESSESISSEDEKEDPSQPCNGLSYGFMNPDETEESLIDLSSAFKVFSFLSANDIGQFHVTCKLWAEYASPRNDNVNSLDPTVLFPQMKVINEEDWQEYVNLKDHGLSFAGLPPFNLQESFHELRDFASLPIEGDAGFTLFALPFGLNFIEIERIGKKLGIMQIRNAKQILSTKIHVQRVLISNALITNTRSISCADQADIIDTRYKLRLPYDAEILGLVMFNYLKDQTLLFEAPITTSCMLLNGASLYYPIVGHSRLTTQGTLTLNLETRIIPEVNQGAAAVKVISTFIPPLIPPTLSEFLERNPHLNFIGQEVWKEHRLLEDYNLSFDDMPALDLQELYNSYQPLKHFVGKCTLLEIPKGLSNECLKQIAADRGLSLSLPEESGLIYPSKSVRVLISNEIVRGSPQLSFAQQKEWLRLDLNARLPTVGEAALLMILTYLKDKRPLFDAYPTRCMEDRSDWLPDENNLSLQVRSYPSTSRIAVERVTRAPLPRVGAAVCRVVNYHFGLREEISIYPSMY